MAELEVTITAETLFPVLRNFGQEAEALLKPFVALGDRKGMIAMREILDCVGDIARARELLRVQGQILSAVADPNGAIVRGILKKCPPCPCGREGSVMAATVYRGVSGGKAEHKRPKSGGKS